MKIVQYNPLSLVGVDRVEEVSNEFRNIQLVVTQHRSIKVPAFKRHIAGPDHEIYFAILAKRARRCNGSFWRKPSGVPPDGGGGCACVYISTTGALVWAVGMQPGGNLPVRVIGTP